MAETEHTALFPCAQHSSVRGVAVGLTARSISYHKKYHLCPLHPFVPCETGSSLSLLTFHLVILFLSPAETRSSPSLRTSTSFSTLSF